MAVDNFPQDSEANPAEVQPHAGQYFPNGTQYQQAPMCNSGYSNNYYYNSWAFASQFPQSIPYQYYYPTGGMQWPNAETAPHSTATYPQSDWQEQSSNSEEAKTSNEAVTSSCWQPSRSYEDWSSYNYSGMAANMYSMFPWMQINRQVKSPDASIESRSSHSPTSISSSGKSQGELDDDENFQSESQTEFSARPDSNLKRPRITFSNKQVVELEKEFHFNKWVWIIIRLICEILVN